MHLYSFDNFCREIKSFSDKGYAVPKIYSWIGLPEFDTNYNFFVLEEYAAGENIFVSFLEDIYYLCKDFCGVDEFKQALSKKDGALYQKIVETHFKKFIETDEKLLDMSEFELEKYIASHYGMIKDQKYSIADIHAGNVMFDGQKLTIIDNGFATCHCNIDESAARNLVLADTIDMFLENARFFDFLNEDFIAQSQSISALKSKNQHVSAEALKRFIKKINYLINPVINEANFSALAYDLNQLYDKQGTAEILAEVQRSF